MNYAVIFPGQGSQAVGMLSAHQDPVITQTWDEAGSVLGWDLARLVREGPVEELNRTERTQPALLAAGIALWRLWQQQNLPAPAALAGHSLGEYTALVAAGALGFADALRLVELRGQLMQAAVPEGQGGMAAVIGLDDAQVEALCAANPTGTVLEPANFNAPGQVVVAGQTAALDWLHANARAHGARMVVKVAMSVPSHSSLLQGAARKLFERLAQTPVHAPAIPVTHNLDAAARSDPDAIRAALRDQLHRPVRWTASVQALQASGCGLFVECGPGKVLAGLLKRISKDLRCAGLEEPDGFSQARSLVVGA
jgi:[acyl-carrier-protein] S-malonyltransferase